MKYTIFIISFFFLTFLCDGASQRPVPMRVDELIKSPETFNEKTVSVIGYYSVEHHGAYLCADRSKANKSEWRIHLDFDHSHVSPQTVARVSHGYVVVTGTFEFHDMTPRMAKDGSRVIPMGFGWMNVYNKQI